MTPRPPHPERAPLARLRPGTKLLALFLFSVSTVVYPGAAHTALALAIAVLALALSGVSARVLLRTLAGFAAIAIPLAAFQAWQNGAAHAFAVVGSLLALILASIAVTASTTASELLDALTRALAPLRRFGVPVESIALSVSLMIRTLPVFAGLARETRLAAKARGIDRDPRALLIPFALRSVAHAHRTGEALAARGVSDDAADHSDTAPKHSHTKHLE